jgi:predicted adenine nucleotide alpha hydrolase (AANH) superfamily ATPase
MLCPWACPLTLELRRATLILDHATSNVDFTAIRQEIMSTTAEYEARILALEEKLEAHHLTDIHALTRAYSTLSQHVKALKSEADKFRVHFAAPLGCLTCFGTEQRLQEAAWHAVEERIDIMQSLLVQAPDVERANRD